MADQENAAARGVKPGALVTVAFLKARLDEGDDHLGIFMPLLADAIESFDGSSFTSRDACKALTTAHGITMPEAAVTTLLKRAGRKKLVTREQGRYQLHPDRPPPSKVAVQRKQVEESLDSLGRALQEHFSRRGFPVADPQEALDKLLQWLEAEQVAVLLEEPTVEGGGDSGGSSAKKEHRLIAEFLRDAVQDDPALQSTVRALLEGLVLYHAAFLPDLNLATRNFKGLEVVCDTVIVRQALGYDGEAARLLMRETVDLLQANGVKCIVFDKTVAEIRRILAVYESKLGSLKGRKGLHAGFAMTRHFLASRYSPSDVREMAALIEGDVRAAGFTIRTLPRRERDHVSGEQALASRLARPDSKGDTEPRVQHDVDCVAGVLQLRKGHRSAHVEGARAIFATSSPTVIQTIREWWHDDENETSIPPVIHIRALANLAWLKKPAARADYKIRELIALCASALRPSAETWRRFLRHLEGLVSGGRITSDESVAIVASAMSDTLLREAEMDADDPEDIDASTLDEVVERVKASYTAKAEEDLRSASDAHEKEIGELRAETGTLAEKFRRRELALDGRARKWARRIKIALRALLSLLVIGGAIALLAAHPFEGTWIGVLASLAIISFSALELFGALDHLNTRLDVVESWLIRRLRQWMAGSPDEDLPRAQAE